jgi:hypothetical protein
VPTAGAAGAFATASGYSFTNFSTLETNSAFGTGNNGVGARFAYVPLALGFGSVRRETVNFDLFGALPVVPRLRRQRRRARGADVNAYRGFDAAADPVFTQSVLLTNSAQLVTFNWFNVSEVEFLTEPARGGRPPGGAGDRQPRGRHGARTGHGGARRRRRRAGRGRGARRRAGAA